MWSSRCGEKSVSKCCGVSCWVDSEWILFGECRLELAEISCSACVCVINLFLFPLLIDVDLYVQVGEYEKMAPSHCMEKLGLAFKQGNYEKKKN